MMIQPRSWKTRACVHSVMYVRVRVCDDGQAYHSDNIFVSFTCFDGIISSPPWMDISQEAWAQFHKAV